MYLHLDNTYVISKIGKVDLDDDEIAVWRLPPKFAIRRKLDVLDMRTYLEMATAKVRYQIHKEKALWLRNY